MYFARQTGFLRKKLLRIMSIHFSKLNRPTKGTLTLFSQHIFNIVAYLLCLSAILFLYLIKHEFPLPKTIRVAAVNIERNFPKLSPWGPGFDREILDEFSNYSNIELEITPYPTHKEAFEALLKGRADLLLASGYNPSIFKPSIPIKAGPVYEKSPALILHNIRRFELRTPFELCDQTIFAPKHSGLQKIFDDLSGYLVCKPTLITSSNATHLAPLLKLNDDKNFRFHLVEAGAFKPLQPFLHRLRVTDNFGDDLEYRWYWRDDIRGLSETSEDFWNQITTNGTIEDKREMYFGFIPDETDFYELYSLRKDIREKLPFYRKYILKAAKKYNIDPLLLAAVMYQESRFDPLARSKTGVRGLMQLTEDTAQLMGISSRLDPEQSITGGAKYLRFLWNKLGSRDVDGWNRWLFTLAAYNQGLGHVYDAIDISDYLGKAPDTWRSLKQIFPLLTMPKYHSQTRYGYTRGYEGVDYVESIRYYYYTMKGLAILPGREAKYLTPFLVVPAP